MTIDLPVPKLYTHTETTMPVHVVRGRKDGPRLFVCAAIHGDEINGIEIIRRLLKYGGLKRMAGTLVEIITAYGHDAKAGRIVCSAEVCPRCGGVPGGFWRWRNIAVKELP